MNKFLVFLVLVLIAGNVYALRINRPPVLSFPINENQISQLNRYLEDIWNIQNGRFELDVVTTSQPNRKNGEIYILQTGVASRIQYKANGILYSITP